jgi:hypothetical protein
MDKIRCLYCNKEKDSNEYSLEHIFPDALGGSLFSEVFKTKRVCRNCNSISGLFIDGPFIKNIFSKIDASKAYLSYVDLTKTAAMPLQYMGRLENFVGEDSEVCEVWLGPHGGIIYHVRQKADDRYDTMIGGNPINNRKNNGWITIFRQNEDLYWNIVLLKSCENYFGNARRISGNIKAEFYFDEPTLKESNTLKFFQSISQEMHNDNITIQEGFEQRFLAKLALGLGYNLFGQSFLNSEYSQTLRNAMWEQDLQKRSELIGYSDYFYPNEETFRFLRLEGLHTLILFPVGDILLLVFYHFGYTLMTIPLCYEREIWSNSIDSHGVVYVAAPQLKIFINSLDIPELIAHTIGAKKNPKLEEIEKLKTDVSQLSRVT